MKKKLSKKQFEEWANKRIKHYAKRMLMDSYDIQPIEYNSKANFLQSQTNYPYRTVLVEYGDKVLDGSHEMEYIERGIVHELIHGIVEPMQYMLRRNKRPTREEDRCVTEQVVDQLALMVWKYDKSKI